MELLGQDGNIFCELDGAPPKTFVLDIEVSVELNDGPGRHVFYSAGKNGPERRRT